MRLFHNRFLLLFLILSVFALGAAAQVNVQPAQPGMRPSTRKPGGEDALMVERARRAEAGGDYARAITIWREVLSRNPWNGEAVQGTARSLLIQKQFDEAEVFLNDYIRRSELRGQVTSPADPTNRFSLTLLLGQLELARGNDAKATGIWNQAMIQAGRSPEVIRTMVTFLQQNRRWEDSEKLIRDYRKESKQPAFMSLELAGSLRSQMNFLAATEELLLYASAAPAGWQMAMNYLNQFPDDSTVAEKVTAALRKAVKADRKNATLWRLVSGYEFKTGNLDESLQAAINADSLGDGGGLIVLQAAEQLLDESEVTLARKGFQRVLSWDAAPDVKASAELGLGRCSEVLGRWDEARAAYERFVEQYPRMRETDEARFRIADILLRHSGQAEEAITLLNGLWQQPQGISRALVGLRIGDCHAWMGKYDAAIQSWTGVARLSGGKNGEEAAHALLRIARAYLWQDSTSHATDLLDSIQSMSATTTAFNDAVLYSALLGDGGFIGAIRAFAEADYASFRNEDSAAAVKYDEAATLLKVGRLAEWARYAQALSLRQSGKPTEAVAVLDSFAVNYPESVDLDRAKYTRAIIRMDDLHDAPGALAEFQAFLVDHPRSIYLEQARRRARILQSRAS